MIKPGGHHGWPDCEGPCSRDGLGELEFPGCDCAVHTNPVITWPHTRGIYEATGGLLYGAEGNDRAKTIWAAGDEWVVRGTRPRAEWDWELSG